MNYISVCSGIEAASVAWHPLGWNCLGVSEIEPFPSAVLAHHYPSVPNFGDMTKFKEWKLNGTVDLLVGGTPCQSFSVAGLRQGLKDPRGNLMLTFLAIAEHFKRPKWILWENVPGVLSSNGGKDFGSFLGGLGELGYGFAYRVLDAQWCRTHRHPRAVPQRRRRVFVVGCLGNPTSAAKVLFERESLSRYSAPRRATRQGTADNVEEGVGSGGDVAATFTARTGEARNNSEHLVADVATVDARNNFDRGDSQHPERLIPCFLGGVELSGPLKARDYKDIDTDGMNYNSSKLVPVATPMLFENHPQDSRVTGPHDVAPSCVSQYGTGGGNVPLVIPIMPQAMQAEGWRVGKENQDGRGNGLGVGKDGDPCPTLDRSAVHAVAFTTEQTPKFNYECALTITKGSPSGGGHPQSVAVAPTITATNDPSRSPQSSEITQQVAAVHSATMQVRRLTPTECERLQGFPDGWTAIPWKKKPADQCPDGPRYKALGNSMAVNCMEWLGERIQAVESGTL